ncbi:uncharacterized protein C9orf57 homolog isoform X1 [Panthera pardus]|uniref:Uncharacterized protein C9orf57 homolog isoform X1 n=1 Tax=Panthera pardus TaxID=9691 RepID=A0A9W2VYZ0_PANPR|nr:uncharacterized protein C9orf57 homolog [Panthera leo]XP_042820333.1 uncharacterized protein C9orf57 homolog [Panthera tigris]XP_049502778.1 uncharacterized protein C9orf57 homolog isoform X1 [Panthera uncia]XP_053763786.1 uncharacterized protein C9orf57 homolog isoform X1 [Panthera pardus]XP_058551687.1 uncharacterized protein C9orf57 homolog isoform X1 [Neofelis nebulosa]XP_060466057.1 uncharacterized protein C9orf57 homolog isoform X1 [Panthera onca]
MRIVFSDVFTLLCLLDVSYLSSVPGGAGGVICRLCNLSIPFHGCLLDLGTCKTKPGQYCVKEIHVKGGIQWYSIQGCTETQDECFKRVTKPSGILSTHCCLYSLCNL